MNRRHFSQIILSTALAFTFSVPVIAQERGTLDEVKALVNKGMAHVKKVGPEVAFKDFTEDKASWINKDIYLFALDMKGNQLAHGLNPKQVGKNFWDFRDVEGKLVFQEFAAAAAKGTGTVEYQWTHPTTKKIETKISYLAKVPGTDYYIGAGAYK
jgi:signal transduction histidine kinase